MIRNIVFDMGKVLVDYSGMPVCLHFTDNEALAKRICTAVFDSSEWVLLDMGVIKEKDGIEKMISRLDTEEEKELAVKCFDHWHEYNMTARPEMGDLYFPFCSREGTGSFPGVPYHNGLHRSPPSSWPLHQSPDDG